MTERPLRRIVRYYTPGVATILEVGDYVESRDEPAGVGWCEAIPLVPGNRHCWTYARASRDGRRVCGLHVRATTVRFGPPR